MEGSIAPAGKRPSAQRLPAAFSASQLCPDYRMPRPTHENEQKPTSGGTYCKLQKAFPQHWGTTSSIPW
ncbi:hypothetical protein SBA3_870007 [Candidatus Sulfopaludibacter sp. SbA3]|nr:hypothetical protein SBA3_870007 [Candidatus Sulfopaludibacter sp. SbA3]